MAAAQRRSRRDARGDRERSALSEDEALAVARRERSAARRARSRRASSVRVVLDAAH
jgi:hypothetical protein